MSIVPSYCINTVFHELVLTRFPDLRSNAATTIQSALRNLRDHSASEYFRSHDLLAYYSLAVIDNPFRINDCASADFEYIPIVPFYWSLQETLASPPQDTNISSLIVDIVKFIEKDPPKVINKRFTVASPFNFRTLMGTGMPTPYRRGYVYDTVTKFVTSLQIGHYERWPQCPDLLRKTWTYIVEMPYVPINHDIPQNVLSIGRRPVKLFFAGRLNLWGPERVCSVRNSISSLATIPSSIIANISDYEFYGPTHMKVFELMSNSDFCVVAKADSYSSSSFYHAIQAGCIPIVISDWMVFSFAWIIPYEEFTIRIMENDFLKDPVGAVTRAMNIPSSELDRMRKLMIV